jgi:hypothetical protein
LSRGESDLATRCFAEQFFHQIDGNAQGLDLKDDGCFFSKEGNFKELPCEEVTMFIFEHIEKENSAKVKADFIVVVQDKCILVPKGSLLKTFSIEYSMVRIRVTEGEPIEKWSEIASSISKKGIYRRLRSPIEGLLVLVYQDPLSKTDRYVLYVDTNNQAKVLRKNE